MLSTSISSILPISDFRSNLKPPDGGEFWFFKLICMSLITKPHYCTEFSFQIYIWRSSYTLIGGLWLRTFL